MAVTSLWRISSRLDKVILYAENPDKTIFSEEVEVDNVSDESTLNSLIDYAQRESATNQRQLVSGINCSPKTAAKEMANIKNKFGKPDGTIAYHGYQSFKENEVTPDVAHHIGVELAERLWGNDYQVVVTTHIDKKSHIHNHFVLNTVSFRDGKKFYRSNDDYRKMQKTSDEICREYGLSVINFPGNTSKKYYTEYMAEKNGELTKNGIIKRDIDECILIAPNEKLFYREMAKRGYTFDFSHKYATIHHPSFPKARRLKTLGDDYTPEAIVRRVYGNWRRTDVKIPEQDDTEEVFFGGDMYDDKVFENYQTVYFRFVFGIGVVKERGDYNRELQRVLGDEIIKFDRWVEEQYLVLDNDLKSDEDVLNFKNQCENEMQELTEARQKLRNQLKKAVRAEDVSEQEELKQHISVLSERIKKIRKNISISERVLENEPKAENKLKEIKELTENNKRKERITNERIQRRSRPDRQDYS